MTTLASRTGEGGWPRLKPESLAAMAWVVWRQHRTALLWLGGVLLTLATSMLIAGIEVHRLYAAELSHGCLSSSAWSTTCRPLQTPFAVGWPLSYASEVVLAMQVIPVLIGVFVGAPLLAREYTTGTVRFTWTQGIGRTRWTVLTLGLLGAAVAAAACVLGLLMQWSVQPIAAQTITEADRWEPGFFDHTALTAATAALLAFMIGVLAGALIRRVVAAMAVTAVCAITVADLTYNRLHYWLVGLGAQVVRDPGYGASPRRAVSASGVIGIHETAGRGVPGPAGSWLDQGWYTGADGHRLSAATVSQLLDKHIDTPPAWLARLHDTFWVSYQPGGRFWLFQSLLGGGTLLVALLLAAATVGLVRYRRT